MSQLHSPSLPEAQADAYRRMMLRRTAVIGGIGLLLLLFVFFDLTVGPAGIGAERSFTALFGLGEVPRTDSYIIWSIRLPQALSALLVGSALALAGAEMQTLLDNPLASPYTLGVSSAASFGAAIALILNVGVPWLPASWLVPASAFLFAFGATMLLQLVSTLGGGDPNRLVLFGIAMVFSFNALVALLQFVASESALQQFVFWTMGDISHSKWAQLAILAAALAVLFPFSFRARWHLNALRFGADRANSFGVPVARLRFQTLLRISILSALAVAFVGTIGFIGLVGPHIARLLVGEDHRFYLPASLLSGAALLSAASLFSKALVPGVLLPVGVLTSLVGVPVFIFLIFRRKGR